MKFNSLSISHAINFYSFKVVLNTSSTSVTNESGIVFHTFLDGSIQPLLMGNNTLEASITIDEMTETEFADLKSFLIENSGSAIYISEEHSKEKLFTESWPYLNYYATVLEVGSFQQADYTPTRSLYSLVLKLSLIGNTLESDVPFVTSFDQLVKINTIPLAIHSATAPASPSENTQWFNTTTRDLSVYLNSAWSKLYTLAPNSTSIGWVNGAFHFSSFNQAILNDITYMPGFITHRGIELPNRSIDIDKGPSIEYLNGFRFSIDNNHTALSEKFWDFVLQNRMVLFGAEIKLYIYHNSTYYLKMTGINKQNSFSYTDYTFDVEPLNFINSTLYPNTYTQKSRPRFTNTKKELLDKPSFVTFGNWDKMALQDVSAEISNVVGNVASTGTETSIFNGQVYQIIGQPLKYITTSLLYSIPQEVVDDINTNPSQYAILINGCTATDTENVGVTRNVVSIDNTTGQAYHAFIELDYPVPTLSSNIFYIIVKSQYQYQMNDNDLPSNAIGTDQYIFDSKDQKFKEIPSVAFQPNADLNMLTVIASESGNISKLTDYVAIGNKFPRTMQTNMLPIGGDSGYIYDSVLYDTHLNPFGRTGAKGFIFYNDTSLVDDNTSKDTVAPTYTLTCKQSIAGGSEYVPASDANIFVAGLKIIVNHNNDSQLLNKKNIRLCLAVKMSATMNIENTPTYRERPCGFSLVVRFVRYNGTYIDNDDWVHKLDHNYLSIGNTSHPNRHTIHVNNFPDGNRGTGGFSLNPLPITKYYDVQIATMGSTGALNSIILNLLANDMVFDTTTFQFKMASRWPGGGRFDLVEDAYPYPVVGAKVLYNNAIYTFTGFGLTFQYNVDTTAYNTLRGQELFKLDSLFEANAPLWSDVASIEICMLANAYEEQPLFRNADGVAFTTDITTTQKGRLYDPITTINKIQLLDDPTLYAADEFNIEGKVIFTSGTGRILTSLIGDRTTNPKGIITDIMNEMYASSKWDYSTLNTLFNQYSRSTIQRFRKQFVKQEKSEAVLTDILEALFACAITTPENKIAFKSLASEDYPTPAHVFNQSNILNGSVQKPKFRKIENVYQSFVLKYGESPVAQFFSTEPKYSFQNVYKPSDTLLEPEIRNVLSQSSLLYNSNNELVKELSYHYENIPTQFAKNIIEHYVFNAWTIKFSVSINPFYLSSEVNLMDYVSLALDYHTNGEALEGFIIDIEPNLYEGFVELTLFITSPPDKNAFVCELLKDALNENRDLNILTANDAGNENRILSEYTADDAKDENRTFTCE